MHEALSSGILATHTFLIRGNSLFISILSFSKSHEPQILIKRDRVSRLLDDRIVTSDLSGRKDAIIANSDILVALPGGVGTLDEIFHLMAGVTIGYHSKRIILYNVNGFWDSLVNMLVEFREKNFLRGELCNYITVVNNIDELENIIKKG